MHYVLSDIHGDSTAFEAVLAMISLQADDHLYVLGDVVDRGPDGIALLQRIREMENATLLLGNHEYMMVKALRNRYDDWAQYQWRRNGCEETWKHFFQLSPEEREDLLQYVEALPIQTEVMVSGMTFVLVHAAPMELYSPYYWRYEDEQEFVVWQRLNLKRVIEGKTVIFGHTPTENVQRTEGSKMRIAHGDGVIDIDCGCAYPQYGGQLGCLRLEDFTEFYSADGIVTAAEAAAWKEEQIAKTQKDKKDDR